MDGNNPKISFIPKGSLVREASFLERRRPRSVAGFLAIFFFVASTGSYAGIYFYDSSLETAIVGVADKIKTTQQTFSNATQVERAQLFSSRANVARGLLDGHTVVSPTLSFLSENTIDSILYNKFSFVYNTDGSKVDLDGEAPTYASLAYQSDVFRERKELLGFTISNVVLNQFGTVSFALSLTFTPDYLLYVKRLDSAENTTAVVETTAIKETDSTPVSATSTDTAVFTQDIKTLSDPMDTTPSDIVNIATSTVDTTTAPIDIITSPVVAITTTGEPTTYSSWSSKLKSIWLKFKFW